MDKNGPIIVIEDNQADQRIMTEIFKHIKYPNELMFFSDAPAALDFLHMNGTVPFLILSDINMPKMNGFEFKEKLRESKKESLKGVPILFFSAEASAGSVKEAYKYSAQGFFKKPIEIDEMEATIRKIVDYWKACIPPEI
jgi:CheY-like chemotaxis protein